MLKDCMANRNLLKSLPFVQVLIHSIKSAQLTNVCKQSSFLSSLKSSREEEALIKVSSIAERGLDFMSDIPCITKK
jgi:hypothetical protein